MAKKKDKKKYYSFVFGQKEDVMPDKLIGKQIKGEVNESCMFVRFLAEYTVYPPELTTYTPLDFMKDNPYVGIVVGSIIEGDPTDAVFQIEGVREVVVSDKILLSKRGRYQPEFSSD